MSRLPWIRSEQALRRRFARKEQLAPSSNAETAAPIYLASFLANLRLLIGLPFEYLVPDPRLLPRESIRFFYLDASWVDRLVQGALAVGSIGTREQAFTHAHHERLRQDLDETEGLVRPLQRGTPDQKGRRGWSALTADPELRKARATRDGDRVVTGFLLRSSAVSGWPHMDVRAYATPDPERDLPLKYHTDDPKIRRLQLEALRIERLSPAVLLALFRGVPDVVVLEEPHHGVQFAAETEGGKTTVALRDEHGVAVGGEVGVVAEVPFRGGEAAGLRVVDLEQLVRNIKKKADDTGASDTLIPDGPASLAVALLKPPFRQRFQGTQDAVSEPGPAPLRLLALRERLLDPDFFKRVAGS